MKKFYFGAAIVALVTCLRGVFTLATGIAERGFGGVNYGAVVFPLLIGVVFCVLYVRQRRASS